MTEMFNSEIIPNYRNTMEKIVKVTSDQTINEYLMEWHQERLTGAKQIQQKYMVISQEYQNQAKSFKSKHEEIHAQELAKREEISKNFENHFAQIKDQMGKDNAQLCDDNGVNEIVKENQMLEEKYEELLKEIEEKSEMMTKEI